MHVGDQRIEIRDTERRVVRADRVADLDLACGYHAGDRRTDLGVAQFQARPLVAGAQRIQVELGVFKLVLRDQAFLTQLLEAREVALELAELRFKFRDLETQPVAVEPCEHLAGLDRVAFLDVDLAHFASNLGDDHCLVVRLDRRSAGIHREHRGPPHGLDFDRDGGLGLTVLLLGLAVAAAANHGHEGECRQDQDGSGRGWPAARYGRTHDRAPRAGQNLWPRC
jgi:hypothetical protein